MPTFNGDASNNVMDYSSYSFPPPAGWPENQAWLQLNGLGGNDDLYGSTYNDSLDGGDGDDDLYGNNGNDGLYGGAGIDNLYGGAGEDWLDGGANNDFLDGGANDDWLTGQAGNDWMQGGSGDDALVGGDGNDTMFGQAGIDQFFGDAGTDTLDGGAGDDRLWGGAGNDQYQYNGQGFDYINDGVTNTETPRTDATYDTDDALIVSYTLDDLGYAQDGNDLLFFSYADFADDSLLSNAVIIQDFFLGGHYVVETLYTSDNYEIDLTQFLVA